MNESPVLETRGRPIHAARHYDTLTRLLLLGRDKALRARTVDLAGVKSGDSVLEVGCGTGEVTLVAKARAGSAGRVAGIDASPEMIEVARAKAAQQGVDIDFRHALIEALPFPDHTFDVVLSSLMMHHLPDDLKQDGLREISRVLKPGGHLLVVDIQRPTNLRNHVLMALLMHSHIDTGTHHLPAMMGAAGFTRIETGSVPGFGLLAFVRGEAGAQE